jgi:ankyrin repeat protein
VKLLVDNGGDPLQQNPTGKNALHAAALGDQPAVLYYLVRQCGIHVDASGSNKGTALHWAASDNSYYALQYLLALGADINAIDANGVTALHLAIKESAEEKNSRCIRLLLKRGADLSIRDGFGSTPRDLVLAMKPDEFKDELLSLLDQDKSCCCNDTL